MKGEEVSGKLSRNWPTEWQKKKKKLYDVLDTRVKMEIVMAKLEYGNLGFCPKLVSSVKKRFKEELAKMDKIEKIRFEIEFAEHWVFAW